MRRLIGVAVLGVWLLAGCGTVRVFRPDGSPGTIHGLNELLNIAKPDSPQSDRRPVTVVFVHGVNDTCPGYALPAEGNDGWLDAETLTKLGIVRVSEFDEEWITGEELRLGAKGDEDTGNAKLIDVRTAQYSLVLPNHTRAPLRMVEVTWSPMTRWMKNAYLAYDKTDLRPITLGLDGGTLAPCLDIRDILQSQPPTPPSRLPANGSLKWGLLDRALSDAVIYVGTYGSAMQRGVAAALCRAVEGNVVNRRCEWPTQESIAKLRYAFVTHSLGSRMVYDTLLTLAGYMNQRYVCRPPDTAEAAVGGASGTIADCAFRPQDLRSAQAQARMLIDHTFGLYMMANQLTMLGLSNVPLTATVGAHGAVRVTSTSTAGSEAALLRAERARAEAAQSKAQAEAASSDSLALFAQSRRAGATPLHIVAFSDTNDLLTWHIPSWYEQAFVHTSVVPVNVFVQNSTHWLGVFESPLAAHTDYFRNSDVWRVMLCGAEFGQVKECRK